MRRLRHLLADRIGSAAVEFAIAVPVLVMMVWGIIQIAIVFQANAGMQHALGEGARLATIWPTPGDTLIQNKITAAKFGLGNGTWDTPVIATDTTAKTKTISVSYHQPTDFLLFPGPTIDLSATKVVYLAQ
ncbi:MAG TPA: TadE/TadG family type IV pilus assembly protein [Sphingomicrobium sp.]|nr:TadE/TadG family type IV pilus assembly protein [Sphingomicrobium sp.]